MGTDDTSQREQASLTCSALSAKRVFPATPLPPNSATVTPLSIIDATVVRFAICAAVWFYDASPVSQDPNTLSSNLEASLRQTLDDYRHVAGSLRWATPDTSNAAYPKYGRPEVVYNTPSDPGVEFVTARYGATLASLVPSDAERKANRKVWFANGVPQDELLPKCDLAFVPSMSRYECLPVLSVQVTSFDCGGWALGVRMTHCLGDAICLVNFVKAWAANACGEPAAKPVFDPSLLDRHAGAVGSAEPDAAKVQLARSLPLHRLDWWDTDADGYPAWARANTDATRPNDEALRGVQLSPSTAPPWLTWDASAPVDHVQLRFSADEVARLRDAARAGLPPREATTLSRLDALLAHLWLAINRARVPDNDDAPVYMTVTLGLRGRVAPPLPDAFAGSPIVIGHVVSTAAGALSLGEAAASLRAMTGRFTPAAVGALLHEARWEVCPQRLWQGFYGARFVGVTSWTRSGAYGVGFGGGEPRYVQGRMPRIDGLVQVMDVGEAGRDFDVSLALTREALGRLLGDGGVWAF